jgi:hypothetical protein
MAGVVAMVATQPDFPESLAAVDCDDDMADQFIDSANRQNAMVSSDTLSSI